MSRILYFDCFNGASGDMVLGALLDAGLPLEELRRALGSLALEGADVSAKRVLRAGVSATKFIVEEHFQSAHSHDHHHEHGDAPSHEHGHEPSHAPATVAHHHAHRSGLSNGKPAVMQSMDRYHIFMAPTQRPIWKSAASPWEGWKSQCVITQRASSVAISVLRAMEWYGGRKRHGCKPIAPVLTTSRARSPKYG